MNLHRLLTAATAGVFALVLSLPAATKVTVRISAPSPLDYQYMDAQRVAINELAGTAFGGRFTGDTERDIALLQRLLDENRVRPDQTQQLQAMGLILGDLLAQDLDMHWVIYEDKIGRSRALRYRETEEYLFPVTMISRRREAGNLKSVADIYRKAYAIIEAVRPKLPFE